MNYLYTLCVYVYIYILTVAAMIYRRVAVEYKVLIHQRASHNIPIENGPKLDLRKFRKATPSAIKNIYV